MKHLSLALLLLTSPLMASDLTWRQAQPETMHRVLTPIVAQGYATGATTNQARFVADFLFALHQTPELDRGPFRIDPGDFFAAWTEVSGTPPDAAPVAIRNVLEFGQHFYVVPVAAGTVRPEPRTALHVLVEWPEGEDRPSSYQYRDRLSDPEVRMRHDRRIEYLLLDYGDFIAYENINGLAGRPVSGGLGALFSLLGMARIESTRLAVADDGTQITRARVRKLFSFTALATLAPDGAAERGIPPGREDLEQLARRLEQDIEIRDE
ncbi:MAG: hypothetical protein ACNA7E_06345 [Wenzhouxiangellaceae bacterium]